MPRKFEYRIVTAPNDKFLVQLRSYGSDLPWCNIIEHGTLESARYYRDAQIKIDSFEPTVIEGEQNVEA